jgi:hypothetical protein
MYIKKSKKPFLHFVYSRRLFVGLENGSIEEFLVGSDYNRLDSQRVYHAHTARVTQIIHAR